MGQSRISFARSKRPCEKTCIQRKPRNLEIIKQGGPRMLVGAYISKCKYLLT